MNKDIKPLVFWPPFIFLLLSALYSLWDVAGFLSIATVANNWILDNFSGVFAYGTFFMLIIVILAYISPLGRVKIGGSNSVPLLSKWKWFTITLCTTIATGILFWATAEPLFHYHEPPMDLAIAPASEESYVFSISTMFMHWSFTPYGIYTCASLLFALVYYNRSQPFSLSSLLFPIFGRGIHGKLGDIINAICLYALIAGMAAALGAGILTMQGGFDRIFGFESGAFLTAGIAMAVVFTFTISASSGLMKGIRILSDINIRIFIGLAILILVFGPLPSIIQALKDGMIGYIEDFIPRSLDSGANEADRWTKNWTVYYWANWLAWTPVTALFLGRLGRGYDVRTFIRFNLLYPGVFSIIWLAIFSGSALHFDRIGGGGEFYSILQESGPEQIIYALLNKLPLSQIIGPIFLFTVFLSYVTAADSNTSAMSGISTIGITPDNPEAPILIKIIWGSLIGVVAWVMITFAGIDGIRMSSNLGGLPALFVVLLVALGLVKYVIRSLY